MNGMFNEGDAVLYMKVGTHANETLADIIARKKREIDAAGFAMWGYGGSTCHPRTMVQPFASAHSTPAKPILLCMQPMESKHFADPIRAEEYSVDGIHWQLVPDKINVLGSRYALCINGLREVDSRLILGNTRVAIGKSMGRPGNIYVKGHVDKACLEVLHECESDGEVPIRLVAEIVEPFAVLLRN